MSQTLLYVFWFATIPLIYFCSIAWHELGHGLMYFFETGKVPVFKWEGGDIVLSLKGLKKYSRLRILAAGVLSGLLVGLGSVKLLWGWHYGLSFLMNATIILLIAWGSMFDVVEILKECKAESLD